MKVEQQNLLLSKETRALLKEEAEISTRGNMSLLADELIKEGVRRKIKERQTQSDDYSQLIEAVKNAREI